MRVFCSSESLLKSSRAGIEYCIPRAVAAIVSWCDLRARRNKCWSETAVCAVRFRAATRMQMSTNRREEKERQQKEKGKKEKKKKKKRRRRSQRRGNAAQVVIPGENCSKVDSYGAVVRPQWASSASVVEMAGRDAPRPPSSRRENASRRQVKRACVARIPVRFAAYASAAAAQEPTAASQL